MVLLLADADDPEAKLTPLSTGVIRVTTGDSDSDSEVDHEEPTVRLVQDPPPSYADVQEFHCRAKTEEATSTMRAQRRFCYALGIALLLCSLPTIIAAILFAYSQASDITTPDPPIIPLPTSERPHRPEWPGDHRGPGRGDPRRDRDPDRRPRYPGDGRQQRPQRPPSEGNLHCSDWVSHPNPNSDSNEPVFVTNYTLSHDGPILIRSFLKTGSGHLRVSPDENLAAEDAFVTITASGISEQGIKDAKVCMNPRRGSNSGLVLKAKGPSADLAEYSIHLFLSPKRRDHPGLGIYLPRFTHAFDDLSFVDFRFIEITGEDACISAASLSGGWVNVHTTNGSIDGHFAAKRMLDISGSSQSIVITANICNNGEEHATAARIVSSSAPIDAKVVLCEPSHESRRSQDGGKPEDNGRYELFVTNSDSPISLKVGHAAPEQGSSLRLNVTNFDIFDSGKSHAMVTLDTGFEGKFSLQSQGNSSLPVSVKSEEAIDDRGGVRYVEVEEVLENGRLMNGKVFWNSPAPLLNRRGSDVWISAVGEGEVNLLLLGD